RVKRESENEFSRRNARGQMLLQERFRRFTHRRSEEGGMMRRRLRPFASEVVAHDVDPVDVNVETIHLRVLEIGAACGSDGQRVTIGTGAPSLIAERIELLAKGLQQ